MTEPQSTHTPSMEAPDSEAHARELVSRFAVNSPEFEQGLRLLESFAQSGSMDARVLMGHLYCQYPSLPSAPELALACYTEAATAGHPEAVMRLADLALFGYGRLRDDTEAYQLIGQLGAAGYASALCQQALLQAAGIGCERNEILAADLVLRAAAQGETLAFALLAERYLEGLGVPSRGDLTWAWLDLAVRRKFPGSERRREQLRGQLSAADIAAGEKHALALMDNIRGLGPAVSGIGVPETDPRYPALFRQAVVDNFSRLDEPALSLDGGLRGCDQRRRSPLPSVARSLSWSPRVFQIDQFLDAYERLYLMSASAGAMVSSADASTDGGTEVDPFDGDCSVFAPHLIVPVVRVIQRRWASVLHVHEQHFEPMSVLRYDAGHEYSPHVDFFDANRIMAHRAVGDRGGQRLITGLIYLIAPESGGETVYRLNDNNPLKVTGQDGSAIFHFNTDVDGLPDPASQHCGMPIGDGQKWLCRTAVRERNLYLDQETVL